MGGGGRGPAGPGIASPRAASAAQPQPATPRAGAATREGADTRARRIGRPRTYHPGRVTHAAGPPGIVTGAGRRRDGRIASVTAAARPVRTAQRYQLGTALGHLTTAERPVLCE